MINNLGTQTGNIDQTLILQNINKKVAEQSIAINNLVSMATNSDHYNPNPYNKQSQTESFKDSKSYKQIKSALDDADIKLSRDAKVVAKILSQSKPAQFKETLLNKINLVEEHYNKALDFINKSEIHKKDVEAKVVNQHVNEESLLEESLNEGLSDELKKVISMLKMAKDTFNQELLTNNQKKEVVLQQKNSVEISGKHKSEEMNEIDDDNSVEFDDNQDLQLNSSINLTGAKVEEESFVNNNIETNNSGVVIDNDGVVPTGVNTIIFLSLIFGFLRRSNQLYQAMEIRSTVNANLAKTSNDLLHVAQRLNGMMSSMSTKLKSLSSDLQRIAGTYGLNSIASLNENNLTLSDLMFIQKATQGQLPGYAHKMTNDEALRELFFMKFDPALTQAECDEIKNFKPDPNNPHDAYFSTIDTTTNRPKHENLAQHFNGAFMWKGIDRFGGKSMSWDDPIFCESMDVSFLGSEFDAFINPSDKSRLVHNGEININDFNTLVSNYFSGMPAVGLPTSSFSIFQGNFTTNQGKIDYYRGMSALICAYTANTGSNLEVELQRKSGDLGKQSTEDYTKMQEQISKFLDAVSAIFAPFAKST